MMRGEIDETHKDLGRHGGHGIDRDHPGSLRIG